MDEKLERRAVRPVQIIEDDDDRLDCRETLRQRPHGAVRPEALVGQRRRGRAGRREDEGQLADPVPEHALQALRPEPGDVVVERVDPHAERQLALELAAAAGEHEMPVVLPTLCELVEQACLADAGFARHRDERRHRAIEPSNHRR